MWPCPSKSLTVVDAPVLTGWIGADSFGSAADRSLRDDLLIRTRLMARAVTAEDIQPLSVSSNDLKTPAYLNLKSKLQNLRAIVPLCKYTYIMIIRDGKILFVADSALQGAEDLSPPGQIYDEASPVIYRTLNRGLDLMEGPLTDRWGTWLSAFIPIRDAQGKIIACFGQDIDASSWHALIARDRLPPVLVTLFLTLLALVFSYVHLHIDEARRRTAESEQNIRSVFNHINDAIFVHDLQGNIIDVNDTTLTIYDISREKILAMKIPHEFSAPHAPIHTLPDIWRRVNAGEKLRFEWPNKNPVTGRLFDVEVHLARTELPSGPVILATAHDITDRKRLEEQLRNAASIDKLTGLPNRALLFDRLSQAMQRAQRLPNYQFALLYLDCDRFKIINDSLGHDVGDLLLIEVGKCLSAHIRGLDSMCIPGPAPHNLHTAARLGGDEFILLLDGISSPDDANIVAERLLTAFRDPFVLSNHELHCTASIGIVTRAQAAARPEDILRDADTAMYEAKAAGKGRYKVFAPSMRDQANHRLNTENQLRHALAAQQFVVHFQPILNLQNGELESFEALVRWNHPTRGIITPAEFIPIAEETGLIIPLGEWVLQQACTFFVRWQKENPHHVPRSISVNLSRNQLVQHNLVQRIAAILEETGIDPRCVRLEITESSLMHDLPAASRTLHQLRALGVKLDMDDFGTGYSSLSCLHQFPIDALKIDRSFIANLEKGRDFVALVSAIITLAHNLGIAVVGEGVETADQLTLLNALDCEFVQGYYFAKPMPPELASTYLPSLIPPIAPIPASPLPC